MESQLWGSREDVDPWGSPETDLTYLVRSKSQFKAVKNQVGLGGVVHTSHPSTHEADEEASCEL